LKTPTHTPQQKSKKKTPTGMRSTMAFGAFGSCRASGARGASSLANAVCHRFGYVIGIFRVLVFVLDAILNFFKMGAAIGCAGV
jgi:hypothetical protein